MKTYSIHDIPYRVHGRTDVSDPSLPIALFWTGSCVEVNVTGTSLDVEYEAGFGSGESYLRIEIDHAEMYRFVLTEGRHTLPVFRGFGKNEIKNVRIFRETQASNTTIAIHSFTTDGEFSEVPVRPMIEFFGDSVTSGEGLAGAKELNLWIPAVFSSRGDYAIVTADALDCDFSIVAQSGWGLYCAYNNVTVNNVPSLYDKVCAVNHSPLGYALGSDKTMDFSKFTPKISVINLGANDSGAFSREAWTDSNGVVHKMRLDADGKPLEEDLQKLRDAAVVFAKKLRRYQPDSYQLWCYNMLGGVHGDTIPNAILQYAAETGDSKVATVKLIHADASMNGSRNHPGQAAHRLYADTIVARIRELGWV